MDKTGFIGYLEGKALAPLTIACYIRSVEVFFKHVKKEEIEVSKPDVLKFLEYLKNSRAQQNITRRNNLIALNHYFTFLYQSGQIHTNPCIFLKIRGANKKKLYKIYTAEELDQLFDAYYQLFVRCFDDSHIPKNTRKQSALSKERNALILSILVNQGVITSEIEKIELDDIDLMKATIKIRGGKNRLKERVLPLKASQIGLMMNYLQNIRPKLEEYHTAESNKLFLALPASGKKKTSSDMMSDVCRTITTIIKTIDKQFFNFVQVRTSVITQWIKTQGLRKAQYMAGHGSVTATELYVVNNIEGLTDDINKLHPF